MTDVPRYSIEVFDLHEKEPVEVLEYVRVPVKGDSIMFARAQWEVRAVLLWPSPSNVDATVWVSPIEHPRRTPDR